VIGEVREPGRYEIMVVDGPRRVVDGGGLNDYADRNGIVLHPAGRCERARVAIDYSAP
jgi:hypothetical protein